MTIRTLVVVSCLLALPPGIARAQTPTTAEVNDAVKKLKAEQAAAEKVAVERALAVKAAADAKVAAPSTGRSMRQPINIKVEFTLTDQRSGGTASKRTVSAIIADGYSGQIRSQSAVAQVGNIPLNIDASPEMLADGKVRVGFTVQYDWPASMEQKDTPRGTVLTTSVHESASLILESGKPMIATQSADPVGDRQVTVEVKATILR